MIISIASRNNLLLVNKISELLHLENEIDTIQNYPFPLYDGKVILKVRKKYWSAPIVLFSLLFGTLIFLMKGPLLHPSFMYFLESSSLFHT